MRRVVTLLMIAAAVLLTIGRSSAAPSTIFIGEAWGGFSFAGSFPEEPSGATGGVTLGLGGRPRGLPIRFYGIASVGFARLEATRREPFDHATVTRDVVAWSFGLRALAPIVARLRVFADFAIGGFHVASAAVLDEGAERLTSIDGSFLVQVGAGLQYRPLTNFSLGARAEVAIPTGLEAFDPIAEVSGYSSEDAGAANLNILLTATLHL